MQNDEKHVWLSPDRWGLTVAALLGEPLPPLPALPGRHCHGLHDEHRGHDWLAESWDAGQAVRPGWRT